MVDSYISNGALLGDNFRCLILMDGLHFTRLCLELEFIKEFKVQIDWNVSIKTSEYVAWRKEYH